ncbi:hypothetical protein EalM132_00099 [Exiguobacterium phage vB_EalM-132]|nr:hypothetical protein EalM132_00099 [Exiguobacterium phage vB_EalM-132]
MGRKKKTPKEKPIVRKPIKLTPYLKNMLILWEQSEQTKHTDIIEIGMYYSMLVRQVKNTTGYRALPDDNPENSKHWNHFEAVYEICSMKGWDYRLYLSAQFDRIKHLKTVKSTYPYPSMLYSIGALKHYAYYANDKQQKQAKDVKKSIKKLDDYQSLHGEISSGIIKTAKTIASHLERLPTSVDKSSYKQILLLQTWREFSPYYLYTVSWMPDLLLADSSKKAKRVLEKFEMLDSHSELQRHVWDVLDDIEKRLNIPENIHL